jgi:uncharacterized membrane-anchored protein YitT (DUF2179 family)
MIALQDFNPGTRPDEELASEGRFLATTPIRHSLLEDAYAYLTGCIFVVLGLVWLKSAGLVTGGIAGMALLLSYFVPSPAGVLFTLLNIPFFLLAGRALGRNAIFKAVFANLLISGLALLVPLAFRLEAVNGVFAALFGGTVIGVGILILARHNVGVGGIGMLAIALQKSRGWNAGRTQLASDVVIVSSALPILGMSLHQFATSIISAAAVAAVLIVYHKPGRYTGY